MWENSMSSLPTELKELASMFNELTDEVKALKTQVHGLEIKVPGDLKDLPTNLEEFTTTVTSLTSQVAELKTLQWKLPTEFLLVPNLFASVQAKLKTLDALPSLLLKVTQSLNMFATFLHSAISKAGDQRAPSAGQASTMPGNSSQPVGEQTKIDEGKKAISLKDAKEESTESDYDDDEIRHVPKQINQQKKIKEEAKAEAARRESEIRKEELIDLLGPKVVNKYYYNKLQYDRYCDKMLNRRSKSRITNCDILTKKGLITLKVYREDDTSEIIHEFKASDLHLGECREDPLDRLNDLANKKRKHVDDIHDFFKANKRLMSSIQYEDHPASTVLNEHVLGNGLDDHARTFSSILLAGVDKRNLNSLKQMRVIE
nr:hypothetical protein [Tanacetum cinerariifolium]